MEDRRKAGRGSTREPESAPDCIPAGGQITTATSANLWQNFICFQSIKGRNSRIRAQDIRARSASGPLFPTARTEGLRVNALLLAPSTKEVDT
jgi:hypothetical protein